MTFDPSTGASGVTLKISGMSCGGCVKSVTRILSAVPGVSRASVDLESGRAEIQGSAGWERLTAAVQAAGYGAERA